MKGGKIYIENSDTLQGIIGQEKNPEVKLKLSFFNLLAYRLLDFEDVCRLYGIALSTGYQWVREWNKHGYISVKKEKNRGGRPPKLTGDDLDRLNRYLEKKDHWHTAEVKQLIKNMFGADISDDQIARILMHKLGMTFSKPLKGINNGSEKIHETGSEPHPGIFDNFTDAIVTTDLEYRVTFWNTIAEKILGWKTEEVSGKNVSEFINFTDLGYGRNQNVKNQDDGSTYCGIETQLMREDGSPANVRLIVSPLINADQNITGLSFIFRDITGIKHTEDTLQSRFELEKLIANISTDFINISPDNIDNEINGALRAIGEFSGVDRSYVFLFSDSGKRMDNTHEWCKADIIPQISMLRGIPVEEDYPDFAERIKRLEVIHVPRVDDLPPEASSEKAKFQMLDIQSLILVPMVYGKKLLGFLGFDSVKTEKTWMEEDIRLLNMVGEIFANALEHKHTEEVLHDSESRYKNLFDDSPISLWENDLSDVKKYIENLKGKGIRDFGTYFNKHPEIVEYCASLVKIIDVNNATLKLYKAGNKELLLKDLRNVFSTESYDLFFRELIAISEGKTTFESESVDRTMAGDKIHIAIKWTAAPGHEETLSKVFTSIIDITGCKSVEKVLHESVARYRSLFEDSPISLWECDMSGVKTYIENLKAGGITDIRGYLVRHPEVVVDCTSLVRTLDVNQASLELYEAGKKEELLTDLNKIFTEESFDVFKQELIDISEGKTSFETETRNVTLRGSELFINFKWTAAPGYEKSLEKVFISIIDITNRKHAEKEREILLKQVQTKQFHAEKLAQDLKKERDTLKVIMENTGTNVAFLDPQFNIIRANPAFTKSSGRTWDELIGCNYFDIFPNPENLVIFRKVRDTKEAVEFTARPLEYADQPLRGVTYWDWTLNPVKDTSGNVYGLVLSLMDVTDFKKAEEIRIENERLLYANKAKSEFLTIMSHELRTPLTSITGYSILLKEKRHGGLSEKQEYYIDSIITSSNHLLELINNILDLARIEAGKLEVLLEKISVPGIINETLELIKEKAGMQHITLEKNIDPELEFIEADRQKFKQILFNLLNNALKFSGNKGDIVTITADKVGNMAQISVSDTGIGIKKEDIDRLFLKFEQLDSGISRKYGGAGLGLAISKQLVEMHGGNITATSKYGVGSTFTFSLPINANKQQS